MIPQILAQIQHLERRLDDAANRVQTMLDEGFGPEPVDTLENNLDLLEKKIHEARHEIAGWRNKWECAVTMGAMAENERDEALKDLEFRRELFKTQESQLNELRADRDILRLDAQREAEHHDRMAKELEGLYDKIKKLTEERDRLRAYIAELLHEPPLKITLKKTP